MIFRRIVRKLIIKLGVQIQNVNDSIAQATLPKFGNNPRNLRIELPRKIVNPERMFLGNDIWLGPDSLLIAIIRYPTTSMQHPQRKQIIQRFEPRITIGDRVTSTRGLQLAAVSEIIIEDDVMFGSNINLTDGLHGYEHVSEPYKYQNIFRISPILIRRGCWLGQNVVILPGVTVGEYSIIGANSVVTKTIPDRSIAVGNPAQVIKKWQKSIHKWVPATPLDDHRN